MKKTTSFLVFAGVVALLASCCGNKCEKLDFLQKDLVVVLLQGEHICCSNPQPPTMFFDTIESRLSGSTGCNRYFAQYQMTDSTVQFNMPGSTRMACDSAANALEVKMLEVLNLTNRYEVTKDELILKNGDSVLAVLKEMKRPEDRCCGGDDKGGCKGKEATPCVEDTAHHCCEHAEAVEAEKACCKGEADKKCTQPCETPCGSHAEKTH